MQRIILTLFVIAAGTLAFAIVEGQSLNAQTNGTHVTTLVKTDVAGVAGKEWNLITVELTPGATDSRHFHRGVGLVYVLEGGGFLEMDGRPPVALNPGVAAALNPEQPQVLKNTSRTQTLKVLVILLLENGQHHLMLAHRPAQRHQDDGRQTPNVDGGQQKTNEQKHSTYTGLGF